MKKKLLCALLAAAMLLSGCGTSDGGQAETEEKSATTVTQMTASESDEAAETTTAQKQTTTAEELSETTVQLTASETETTTADTAAKTTDETDAARKPTEQTTKETTTAMETTTSVTTTAETTTETAPTTTAAATTTAAKPVSEGQKVIALTFDDGPNTTTTVQVLDKLEKYDVVASFFLIGKNITPASAESARRALDMGCELGSHSWSHSYMNKMSAEEIKKEIKDTSDKIYEEAGVYPKFFRPPYIAVNDTMHDSIDLPFICGVMANDWEDSVSAEKRAEKILSQAKDGAIILLHDTAGNSKTVEALDTIIPGLQEQGYQLVTVSQLFEAKGVTPAADKNIVYTYTSQS